MHEHERREAAFVTEKSKSAVTIAVTGAIGGPSPDRTAVVAHLFVDYSSVPSIVVHSMDDAGRVNMAEGKPTSRGDVTREVQATLVLTPEGAVNLGQWLLNHGTTLLNMRKTPPPNV